MTVAYVGASLGTAAKATSISVTRTHTVTGNASIFAVFTEGTVTSCVLDTSYTQTALASYTTNGKNVYVYGLTALTSGSHTWKANLSGTVRVNAASLEYSGVGYFGRIATAGSASATSITTANAQNDGQSNDRYFSAVSCGASAPTQNSGTNRLNDYYDTSLGYGCGDLAIGGTVLPSINWTHTSGADGGVGIVMSTKNLRDVTYDACAQVATATSGTSASGTFTPVGTPSFVAVVMSTYAGISAWSATYGGVAMTNLLRDYTHKTCIAYLLNPPGGAQTVAASWTTSDRYALDCVSALNVGSIHATGTDVGVQGNPAAASLTINCVANGMVIDLLGCDRFGGCAVRNGYEPLFQI
jgi:hypothetical protein